MEPVNPSSTSADLLADLEGVIEFNYASKGQRFVNFLIDNILSILFYALGVVGLAVLVDSAGGNADALLDGVFGYVLAYAFFVLYYTLAEGLTGGRTLGKLITGTYAVGMDGAPLTVKQAFYRGLCRMVPLEPFSAFGTPWHDKWTETTVLKK